MKLKKALGSLHTYPPTMEFTYSIHGVYILKPLCLQTIRPNEPDMGQGKLEIKPNNNFGLFYLNIMCHGMLLTMPTTILSWMNKVLAMLLNNGLT